MKYRLTCLTPLLVGDGRKLSPIDYMVWKDQINVLDQRRIFRLLAKGPRLDSYLAQLKKADKLDFASWGGFAQNFADRRIPFEHSACSSYWERAQGESLHIPTFVSGPGGPYLPGTAIKGALRTGLLLNLWKDNALADVAAQFQGERAPRHPGDVVESRSLGAAGASRMRVASAGDSAPVPVSVMKVYLLRVSTLQARGGKLELGWKQSPRGTVDGRRPEDGTPWFAEMAAPGAAFEGTWQEDSFFAQPEIVRALNWREPVSGEAIFRAANEYAAELLEAHRQYAVSTGMSLLERNLDQLASRLGTVSQTANSCLISLGWGGGILGKTALLRNDGPNYRLVLQQVPLYAKALSSGLPFPKTRRIVFLENQPATLPGWALLEIL